MSNPATQSPEVGQDHSTAASELDVFQIHLSKYDNSKTIKLLSLLYSVMVALLTTEISGRWTQYSKIVGLVLGVVSLVLGRAGLRVGDRKAKGEQQKE